MDDSRIRQLTAEVLSRLQGSSDPAPGLESRVAALEAAVSRLQQGAGWSPGEAAPALHIHSHPSLHVLNVPSGGERCLMEPDRPCVQSHACRVLGH